MVKVMSTTNRKGQCYNRTVAGGATAWMDGNPANGAGHSKTSSLIDCRPICGRKVAAHLGGHHWYDGFSRRRRRGQGCGRAEGARRTAASARGAGAFRVAGALCRLGIGRWRCSATIAALKGGRAARSSGQCGTNSCQRVGAGHCPPRRPRRRRGQQQLQALWRQADEHDERPPGTGACAELREQGCMER